MRNKASLIPVALIALVGIVFASGIYFPDNNPGLPRLPVGPGTIGGVLQSLFAPDGTATNTEKLGGITATGYLHNNNCTDPINKKWVGVDTNGQGICGVGTPVFAAIGKFGSVSPGVQVMKNGSSTWTPANTTDDLFPGDTIATNGGTAMIDFALDASILRLDTNTTVELRLGNLDGNSVAEAILSDGRLWGRILTSTGVNLGGGGVVAGVRGTSVSIEKTGPSYVMSIIDSQRPTNAATIVPISTLPRVDKTTGTTIISEGTVTEAPAFSQVNSYSGYVSAYISPVVSTRENLISMSPWIRENTKSDIEYLYTNSGGNTIVKKEYDITVPDTISTAVLTALCGGIDGDTEIYWKSLIGTVYDKCQPSSLLAFGDYGNGDLSLYFSGQVMTASGTKNISATGQYLGYILDPNQLNSIKNQTLKIKLANSVGISIPNPNANKWYIFDGGSASSRYYVMKDYKCISTSPTPGQKWLCNGATVINEYNGSNEVNISVTSPIQFIVGNMYIPGNPTLHLSSPIGTEIVSISVIKNN